MSRNRSPVPAKPPLPWRAYLAAAIVTLLLVWSALPAGDHSVKGFQWAGAGLMVWNDDNNHAAGVSFVSLAEVARLSGVFFRQLFPSPGHPWPTDYLIEIRDRMTETIRIAFAASVIGSLLALVFSLIGARNLAINRFVYAFGRIVLNLVRTIPDLVLASVFAIMLGIGPLPGLVALTIFSFGLVAKLLCDTVETIDPGPTEAIAASGGTRLQSAVFAVFPQVAPDYLSYTLYAFEYNVRAAVVLGYVGAGGIGMIIQSNVALLDYLRLGLIISITFVFVFLIDSFSTWLRSRLV